MDIKQTLSTGMLTKEMGKLLTTIVKGSSNMIVSGSTATAMTTDCRRNYAVTAVVGKGMNWTVKSRLIREMIDG